MKDFGPVGPSHPNGAWSRYVMGVDDTHAYIASGMIPAWYLVAVNLQTGEEKVLLRVAGRVRMDIVESFPGAWVLVPQDGDTPRKEYWLYHGQAIPKTGRHAAVADEGVALGQGDSEAGGLLRPDRPRRRRQRDALVPLGGGCRERGTSEGANASRRHDEAHSEEFGWKSIHLKALKPIPSQSPGAPARWPALRHGRV